MLVASAAGYFPFLPGADQWPPGRLRDCWESETYRYEEAGRIRYDNKSEKERHI